MAQEAPNHRPTGRAPSEDRAWTRIVEPDGQPGQWYLHLFAPEQPDLDWSHPEVRSEFEAILRFWFERGADGFRIDVAHGLVKDPAFADLGPRLRSSRVGDPRPHPFWDQDGVHEIYRGWRAVADAYGDRPFVAEVFVAHPERLARFVRPDELHTAFDFRFLEAGWNSTRLRQAIDDSLRVLGPVGAPATWVLSNHDQTRHVTRFGRPSATSPVPLGATGARRDARTPPDLELGRRRARAAVLLMLGLPGCAYLYQGEELGLEEVEDLPDDLRQDPVWLRSGHRLRGRDGCRVPLPWFGAAAPFGFGPVGSTPWLPQPADWAERTVAAQTGDPGSMLELYRDALRIRREHPGFRGGSLTWCDAPEGLLHFERTDGLEVVVNLAGESLEVPTDRRLLLSSLPLDDGRLPGDAAAWFG